jgi:hypothetical protein
LLVLKEIASIVSVAALESALQEKGRSGSAFERSVMQQNTFLGTTGVLIFSPSDLLGDI